MQAVWYLSGDQQCFAGDHITLGVVSLLVLLLLLATIPTVVLLSRHQIKVHSLSVVYIATFYLNIVGFLHWGLINVIIPQ